MDECPEKTWVDLFVRGQLKADDVSRLEAHIDECADCLARVADVAEAAASRESFHVAPAATQDSILVHLMAALARASDAPLADEAPSRVHTRFGRYRVVDVLGRGGMGIVYSAVDDETGKRAAIKTVLTPSAKLLASMRQEIAFLRSHRHPGVVPLFDDGVLDGDPWYAMELFEWPTLADFNRALWLDRRGKMGAVAHPAAETSGEAGAPALAGNGSLRDILSIFARLCVPLDFVHREGIVHCDLKPANVFLREDQQPILLDFGLLSRAGGAIGRETLEVGGLRGTLPYLSPELVRGRIPDARADLYALGCMLYESITGRPPFASTTIDGLLKAHLYVAHTPPSRLVAGLSPELDELLAALLAKDPEKRIGGAAVVEEILTSLLESRSRPPASPSIPYLFRPRLVGRDGVVEEMKALRGQAEKGRGSIAFIGGESGIGKTFLASELAQSAMRSGFEVVTGECMALAAVHDSDQPPSGAPLAPFRNLLQRAADRYRSDDKSSAATLFESPRTVRVLARYEPAWLHVAGGEREEPPALPPPAERERALEAMRELLLRSTTDRPLLLIIDDLQWADDLSFALLESLATEFPAGARLLIIALYRSEEGSRAIARIKEQRSVRTIALERLDDGALRTMVGDLLSRPAPPALVRALSQHSEGNPFFVAEYLRAAAIEGLLVRSTDGWRLVEGLSNGSRDVDELPLPRSLHELLGRRIQLLGQGAQKAAEIASVLGRTLHPAMIASVAGASERQAEAWIEEMLDRQLVERTPSAEVRFAHDKIRELAYTRVSVDRRRELHFAAASAIEAVHVGEGAFAGPFGELAYHFQRGGAPARAVDYFEKAAEQALRSSANVDAVRFFQAAIETSNAKAVDVPRERRGRWERRMGDALQGSGDLSGSKEHLLQSLAYLGQPLPGTRAGMGVGIAEKLATQIVRRARSRRWVEGRDGDGHPELEIARAYDRLMQVYYYRGEYTPLLFANLATLDFAERAPPSPTLAVAYTNAAATAGIIPLPRVAAIYFRLAESTLRRAYDPEVDSYLQVLRCNYAHGLGDGRLAAACADKIIAIAGELGFRRRWEEGAALQSNLGLGRDFDASLEWCDRMAESATRRNDTQLICWGFLRRAEIHVARGDLARAAENLPSAERMIFSLGLPEQIRGLGLRAILLLREGRVDEALAAADDATLRIKETRAIHFHCVDAYARIAEVHLAAVATGASHGGRARQEHARVACETLRRAARTFPAALPHYCRHEGTRRWLSGEIRAARKIWGRGLQAAVEFDVPDEEAFLRLRRSEACAACERALHAEAAHRILTRLGVQPGATAPVV